MLRGRVIAVLRSKPQAEETSRLIEEYGGKPYLLPVIEVRLKADERTVRGLVDQLLRSEFDYTVFTSVNCARILFEAADRLSLSSELKEGLQRLQLVAIGSSTRSELQRMGLQTVAMPRKYSSRGIVEHLRRLDMKGRRILIPRVDISGDTLTEGLKALGSKVEVIPIYEIALPPESEDHPRFIEALKGGRVDAVLFTSPSTVSNLFTILCLYTSKDGVRGLLNSKTIVVAIGPVTVRRLKEYKVKVDVQPEEYTIKGMLDALTDHWTGTK